MTATISQSTLRNILTLIALIAFYSASFSQSKDAQNQDWLKEAETLKKLNRDWLDCYVTKDAKTLSAIFAYDFVLISPNGVKMTKQNIIDNLKKQDILSVKIDTVDARLLTADVGIITAYTTFTVKADNKELSARNCYQDVYMKRNGKWEAVSAHVTLLSMSK